MENAGEKSALVVATKADLGPENVDTLRELYGNSLEILPASTVTAEGLPALGKRLWELLDSIRVYTKEPGKPVDRQRPYTLPVGSTLEDLVNHIHRDLLEKMKFARIWGDDRFEGTRIQKNEVLRDKDVVEIHQ
jgi:ribosome-interacting GTPase 1